MLHHPRAGALRIRSKVSRLPLESRQREQWFPHVGSRVFRQLGFRVAAGASRPRHNLSRAELQKALPHRRAGIGPQFDEYLELPVLHLQWFEWEHWEDLVEYGAAIVDLPFTKSGVYEVRLVNEEERLVIGRANDLHKRVLHGLVWGTAQHTAGRKTRENEDLTQLRVRWAITDRPATAEEELHRRHIAQFGRLPKYTLRT